MLNVLLVEIDITDNLLENALTIIGFEVLKTQYDALFLTLVKETKPDILIFNLDTPPENLIHDLHILNLQFPLPVVIFASDSRNETINKVMKAEVSALIIDGLTGHRINSVIQVAVARFKQQQVLKEALEDARHQLEDRKQIDRAKAILIKTQNFSEHEAYHTLRKLAMDRNITLGEMARNVIAMADLLK